MKRWFGLFYCNLVNEWKLISWASKKQVTIMLIAVFLSIIIASSFFSLMDVLFFNVVQFLAK